MKHVITLICITTFFLSCNAQPEPQMFSEEVLHDTFLNLEGQLVSLQSILDKHKGKTIFIDVWASWCRDCLVGFPEVKALQEENNAIVFLFLSMDKTENSWKNGIKKYAISGEHYFMPSGWDSAFSKFVDLDWIPRYMIVDSKGQIQLFRAIKANDPKIKEYLK